MNVERRSFIWVVIIAITMGIGMSACSKQESETNAEKENSANTTQKAEEILQQRALARWDALIKRDFDLAYSFMSPAYRKLYSSAQYASNFGSVVKWQSVKVKEVVKEGSRAEIILDIFYQLAIPGADLGDSVGVISKQVNETWLLSDGEWWYASEDMAPLL